MIWAFLLIVTLVCGCAVSRKKQPKERIVSTPILILGIIFLGLPVLFVIFTSLTPEGRKQSKKVEAKKQVQKTRPDIPDKIGAYVMAQSFVQPRLKAPTTAKFPWWTPTESKVIQTNNRYKVVSYVVSQNTFGAMVRTYYTVIIEHLGGDEWRLIDITLAQ